MFCLHCMRQILLIDVQYSTAGALTTPLQGGGGGEGEEIRVLTLEDPSPSLFQRVHPTIRIVKSAVA